MKSTLLVVIISGVLLSVTISGKIDRIDEEEMRRSRRRQEKTDDKAFEPAWAGKENAWESKINRSSN